MAKLKGVKTLDMVDGQITKVEYNGEIYEKVDESASEGDIVQVTAESWGSVESGEFYRAIETVEDDDGDRFTRIEFPTMARGFESDFDVFRKVAGKDSESEELDERVTALESNKKPERKLKVGDKVRTLARGMFGDVEADGVGKVTRADDGSKFSVRVTTEDDYDYFRPQDLELITEKPWKKGDKVHHKRTGKVVTVYAYQPEKRTYGNGAGWSFTGVAEGFTYIDEFDFEYWDVIEYYELITESEYVPVEEKAEYERAVSPPFQVGEYVRVIEGKHGHEGKVVKIIADDFCEEYPYDTELLDGLEGDCYSAEHLEKVTDEEVKLAKLGRKPGEFKKGDIVAYRSLRHGRKIVYEVSRVSDEFVHYYMPGFGDDSVKMNSTRLELVAPVESRVDL